MRSRAWLLLGLLPLFSCTGGTHDVQWKVVFGSGSPGTATYIHAEIRAGGCTGSQRVLWDVSVDHMTTHGLGMDMALPPGTYGIYAEGRDATCTPTVQGCQMVTLPGAVEPIVVTLTTPATVMTPACTAAMCMNGYCSGAVLPDLGPPDMGTDMPPGTDGGTCGGCRTSGGTCVTGNSSSQCGTGGAMCAGCGASDECVAGACTPRSVHFALSAVTSFMLTVDGHVRSSGANTSDQRGNFAAAMPFSFEAMSDAPGNGHAVAIASAQFATYAIDDGGLLYSWGSPALGLLGRGGSTMTPLPGVIGSHTWTSVSAGNQHACGIQADGTLWCWGDGTNGRLGNGGTAGAGTPTQVMVGSTFLSVSCGNAHTCAIRSDHTLWCWGSNFKGQLGNGMMDSSMAGVHATPAQVETNADWSAVAASIGGDFTCGIRAPGSLWCWGDNGNGELGIGTTAPALTPALADMGTPTPWTAVSAGEYHACGIRGSSLLCWGANTWGSLGDGSTSDSHAPEIIVGSWAGVSAGWNWTCATKTDMSSYCWGRNMGGVLGIAMDGTTTMNVTSPTAVVLP